jgi:hypothetical protein
MNATACVQLCGTVGTAPLLHPQAYVGRAFGVLARNWLAGALSPRLQEVHPTVTPVSASR